MKLRGFITVSQLITYGLAIVVPITMASVAYTSNQMSKLSDANLNISQRVSVVETESTQYQRDILEIKVSLKTIEVNQAAIAQALNVKLK